MVGPLILTFGHFLTVEPRWRGCGGRSKIAKMCDKSHILEPVLSNFGAFQFVRERCTSSMEPKEGFQKEIPRTKCGLCVCCGVYLKLNFRQ